MATSLPEITTGTHTGTRPGPNDDEDRVCHLLAGGVALCGAGYGVWGIPKTRPERRQSPCTCGLPRCPDCLAEL